VLAARVPGLFRCPLRRRLRRRCTPGRGPRRRGAARGLLLGRGTRGLGTLGGNTPGSLALSRSPFGGCTGGRLPVCRGLRGGGLGRRLLRDDPLLEPGAGAHDFGMRLLAQRPVSGRTIRPGAKVGEGSCGGRPVAGDDGRIDLPEMALQQFKARCLFRSSPAAPAGAQHRRGHEPGGPAPGRHPDTAVCRSRSASPVGPGTGGAGSGGTSGAGRFAVPATAPPAVSTSATTVGVT
jgi:hypothetical protein